MTDTLARIIARLAERAIQFNLQEVNGYWYADAYQVFVSLTMPFEVYP